MDSDLELAKKLSQQDGGAMTDEEYAKLLSEQLNGDAELALKLQKEEEEQLEKQKAAQAAKKHSSVVVKGEEKKREVVKKVEREEKKEVVKKEVKKVEEKKVEVKKQAKMFGKMEVDQEGGGKEPQKKGKTPISLLFEQLRCPEWRDELRVEFGKPYISKLEGFLREQEMGGKKIFPPLGMVFDALNRCPLSKVRVVMLGQDPYHGPNQAHGLCFSVQKGVAVPPSLRNMYKELTKDIKGFKTPPHGNLNKWANQGVLLLNTTLTVEKSKPKSHAGKGWETLTDKIISIVNQRCKDVVFLLWGSHAQTKGKSVSQHKHLVLKCAHPSPLSAHNGFFGCGHFSKTNEFLKKKKLEPIDWLID